SPGSTAKTERLQLRRLGRAAPDGFRANRHQIRSVSARKFAQPRPVIRAGRRTRPSARNRGPNLGGDRRMAIVGWLVALALGIVLALFSVGNQQPAVINVLGATYQDIPTWVVMLACAAIGALMVLVISVVDRVRWFMATRFTKKVLAEHKKMIVQRDNRISELEQEVLRLRGAAGGNDDPQTLPAVRVPLQRAREPDVRQVQGLARRSCGRHRRRCAAPFAHAADAARGCLLPAGSRRCAAWLPQPDR